MRHFWQNKVKVLFLCGFVLFGLTGCSNPRGQDGKTKLDQVISSEKIEIKKDQVNISDITDKEFKKKYEKLDDDATIVIEPTEFKEVLSRSWFDGLIVWPIAQLINVFASFTDAGMGIILATLLIQLLIFAFTYKSQLSMQRMQEVQGEMTKIQNKYRGREDERSKMMMAQEMQKLYEKYDIHPFGSMFVTFIQMPVMIGVYYATMRAATVMYGSFLGMPLSVTPLTAIKSITSGHIMWGPIIIFILMIVFQILTLQLPKWLKKMEDKKNHVKVKNYLKNQKDPMADSMNISMYFMTAMIAFLALNWPIAMSFYWLVTSVIRAGQTVALHFVIEKKGQQQQGKKSLVR